MLTQLLPEYVHHDRHTGSSAWIQETYAGNFPCLLRIYHSPAQGERNDDCKKPHPF
jgi:hypothetical protein